VAAGAGVGAGAEGVAGSGATGTGAGGEDTEAGAGTGTVLPVPITVAAFADDSSLSAPVSLLTAVPLAAVGATIAFSGTAGAEDNGASEAGSVVIASLGGGM
jgi:hypothetical protein